MHGSKAIPKIDGRREPLGYSAHIKKPNYFIASNGWLRRTFASADLLIKLNLVWEFDRNTDDVKDVLADKYDAYESKYNGKIILTIPQPWAPSIPIT
jgi:hypothetical protein